MPVSAITALQAVTDLADVQAGQRVLVTGASGGVGSYAVQIAVAAGAEVTGVASAAKADLVRSLGATHVLDYASDDFAAVPDRYDVIIDIAGNASLSRLRRALTPTGTAVLVGGEDAGRAHRHEPPAPRARRLPVRAASASRCGCPRRARATSSGSPR